MLEQPEYRRRQTRQGIQKQSSSILDNPTQEMFQAPNFSLFHFQMLQAVEGNSEECYCLQKFKSDTTTKKPAATRLVAC